MQPHWITAPVQKSSSYRGVSDAGAVRATISHIPKTKVAGWEAHALQPGKEPACAQGFSCRKQRIAEGLDTYQETRKGTAKDVFSSDSGMFMKCQIPRQW